MRRPNRPPAFTRAWLTKPVIPVLWQVDEREEMLADASLLFLQGGELAELPTVLERLRRGRTADIPVMLHIDLLAGLTSDEAGVRYIAGLQGIAGIITVRSHVVSLARKHGLASILLLFLQDGRSIDRGLHLIEQSKPDMVELVPGVAALDTAAQFANVGIPKIAGGLVRTVDLVQRLAGSGFAAVSSSNATLWTLNRSRSK